jgi:hypothetical protein
MEKEVIQEKSKLPKIHVETEVVRYNCIDDYSEHFIAKRQRISPETFKLISVSVCITPQQTKYASDSVLVTITYSI